MSSKRSTAEGLPARLKVCHANVVTSPYCLPSVPSPHGRSHSASSKDTNAQWLSYVAKVCRDSQRSFEILIEDLRSFRTRFVFRCRESSLQGDPSAAPRSTALAFHRLKNEARQPSIALRLADKLTLLEHFRAACSTNRFIKRTKLRLRAIFAR